MARPTRSPTENRRGSPEAVEKRRLARKLNRLLTEGSTASPAGDGRTARRRQRLLKELEEGTHAEPPRLKPIEVLQHAHDLLEMGVTFAAIRKAVKVPAPTTIHHDEAVALLTRIHAAYGFRTEVYELVALPPSALATLRAPDERPRRGRPRVP